MPLNKETNQNLLEYVYKYDVIDVYWVSETLNERSVCKHRIGNISELSNKFRCYDYLKSSFFCAHHVHLSLSNDHIGKKLSPRDISYIYIYI